MEERVLNEVIEKLCLSKVEEFQLLGYEYVNGPDIWQCVSTKYYEQGFPPLYQIVNDILSLRAAHYMDYITLNMYKAQKN